MRKAREIRGQLVKLVESLLLTTTKKTLNCESKSRENVQIPSSTDESCIRKCLCSGFFFNASRLSITGDSYRLAKNTSQTVFIHPSSVFFCASSGAGGGKEQNNEQHQQVATAIHPPPKWVIYHELVLTTKEFMRQVIQIEPEWLLELAPQYFKPQDIAKVDWRRQ